MIAPSSAVCKHCWDTSRAHRRYPAVISDRAARQSRHCRLCCAWSGSSTDSRRLLCTRSSRSGRTCWKAGSCLDRRYRDRQAFRTHFAPEPNECTSDLVRDPFVEHIHPFLFGKTICLYGISLENVQNPQILPLFSSTSGPSKILWISCWSPNS